MSINMRNTQVGDGTKFPQLLQNFEKRNYNITLTVTKENVKDHSHVFDAFKISNPDENFASHSPTANKFNHQDETEINHVSIPFRS